MIVGQLVAQPKGYRNVKEHVPKAIRQKSNPIREHQEEETHRFQPTRTQLNRKCKAKSKNQFELASDLAIGQHLLESNLSGRNYYDSWFKILTAACSQFHLSLLEAVYISRKKRTCAGKSSLYLPFSCSYKIWACCHYIAVLGTADLLYIS